MEQSLVSETTHAAIESPLGDLTVVLRDGALAGLYFSEHWYRPAAETFGRRDGAGTDEIRRQLGEYFAGQRRSFALPRAAPGTDYQLRVWALIDQVPYGATATYGDLARELGEGTTARDVGAAVGRNPLSIIVPCHRIVGSTGKLTGYAGGLERKQFLLDLEREVATRPDRLF